MPFIKKEQEQKRLVVKIERSLNELLRDTKEFSFPKIEGMTTEDIMEVAGLLRKAGDTAEILGANLKKAGKKWIEEVR